MGGGRRSPRGRDRGVHDKHGVSIDVELVLPLVVFLGEPIGTSGHDFEAVSGKLEFATGEYKKSVSVKTLVDCVEEGDASFVLKFYDFEMSGCYRDVEGWMTPPIALSAEFPHEWELEGKIVDKYDEGTVARGLGGGC